MVCSRQWEHFRSSGCSWPFIYSSSSSKVYFFFFCQEVFTGSPVHLFRAVSDLRILHLLLLVLLEVLCEFLGFWFQTKHSASLSLLPLAMTVCFCMTQAGRRQASLTWSPWGLFPSLFRGWGRRVSLGLSLRGPSRTSRSSRATPPISGGGEGS